MQAQPVRRASRRRRTLARLRERDARIDELLLQLVGAHDSFLLAALRRADAVADDAADHQTEHRADRAADERASRRAPEHTATLFLRELVVARVRGARRQRHGHRANQHLLEHDPPLLTGTRRCSG